MPFFCSENVKTVIFFQAEFNGTRITRTCIDEKECPAGKNGCGWIRDEFRCCCSQSGCLVDIEKEKDHQKNAVVSSPEIDPPEEHGQVQGDDGNSQSSATEQATDKKEEKKKNEVSTAEVGGQKKKSASMLRSLPINFQVLLIVVLYLSICHVYAI